MTFSVDDLNYLERYLTSLITDDPKNAHKRDLMLAFRELIDFYDEHQRVPDDGGYAA